MSRWWRAYDEAVDDPKLLLLTDRQHRVWFNLMCIASIYGGKLPDVKIIAVKLRMKPDKAKHAVAELVALKLIDLDEAGVATPHNWDGRQYKSDVSTERVKRFRNGKRNVSVTPPDNRVQNTETDKKPEADASAADAPRDVRKDLFGKGRETLERITGKTPDSCRALIGRLLKSVNDEAIHVLGAIEDAERNRVADPVAWITKTLQPRVQNGQGRPRTVQQAAQDQLDTYRAIVGDGAPTLELELQPGIRDGTGAPNVRLLPSR